MKWILLLALLVAVAAQDRRSISQEYYDSSYWNSDRDSARRDYQEPIGRDYKELRALEEPVGYSHEVYPYQIIGRHGLGFENRITRASGLRNPITPEALEHVGKRYTYKELIYAPLNNPNY